MRLSKTFGRPAYLKKLWAWKDDRLIKAVIGPRRSGKSVLLSLYRDRLKQSGVAPENIIAFNLEDYAQLALTDPHALHEAVLGAASDPHQQYYVFIDEVQACREFERVVSSLALRENIDLYITGSNARLLSGDLATLLSGRYVSIEMMPLSFAEFRSAVAADGLSADEDFRRYLNVGGFPAVVPFLDEPEKVKTYYSDLLDAILMKDIVSRLEIRNPDALMRVIRALSSSIGSPVSARRLTNTLKSAGRRPIPSNVTVGNYLKALEAAFFCYRAQRFDVKGNQFLSAEEKYYLCDHGFRHMLVNARSAGLGHVIENIVYLELRRRYPKVAVGKAGAHEIDFVARSGEDVAYFQVAQTVMAEETLARELASFEAAKDNYPKTLLTLDRFGAGANYQGVRQVNLVDWLLETGA